MAATTKSIVTGTDFVSVPTQDINSAVEFYGDLLGLRKSVHNAEVGFAEFETGNLTLGIVDPVKMGIGEFAPSTSTVALHVDDVAAARAEYEAAGISFQGEVIDTGVCHMAIFQDLDGNGLMLHHRYAPRTTDVE